MAVAGVRAGLAWPLGLGAGILAAFGYYVYLRVEAQRDGDLGQERGRAVSWRRLYTYLAALAATILAFVGGGELIRVAIRVLMTPLSGDVTWHGAAAGAAAALIVGIPLGAMAWGAANRAATMNPAAETNCLSRVLLRYDGILDRDADHAGDARVPGGADHPARDQPAGRGGGAAAAGAVRLAVGAGVLARGRADVDQFRQRRADGC